MGDAGAYPALLAVTDSGIHSCFKTRPLKTALPERIFKMAIITISRGSASGGELLAEGLAKKLGYQIVSRDDIIQEATKFGVPEAKLDEALVKSPGFWERFTHGRRRYLAFVQAALCERARHDGLIYHGNAGHILLSGVSHVFNLRLIAPLPFRMEMAMKRFRFTREDAMAYIQKVDQQRKDWTLFLYGEDWLDPNRYDLIINLKTLDIPGAVELAALAAKNPGFTPTDKSNQDMANLLLASRVRAALAASPETSSAEVGVTAHDGTILLKGKLRNRAMVKSVIAVAGRVPGVAGVDRDALDAPDLTV